MSFHSDPEMRDDLRKPFPPQQISKLPGTAKRPSLDYVSHAAVTDRLNHAAPDWTYSIEPVVVDRAGTPHVVAVFGHMTIGGVSRPEVGAVDSPSSYGQELKEAISDFIRRGAMRFGVALDLWAKEDLLSVGAGSARGRADPAPTSSPVQGRGQAAAGEGAYREEVPSQAADSGAGIPSAPAASTTPAGDPSPPRVEAPASPGDGSTTELQSPSPGTTPEKCSHPSWKPAPNKDAADRGLMVCVKCGVAQKRKASV